MMTLFPATKDFETIYLAMLAGLANLAAPKL